MPQDIRLKRIAGNLLIMAQSGQYNFSRCLLRGEAEAAQLACDAFVQAAMKVWFHLHKAYMPYYKWSFRALRQLEGGEALAEKLSLLLLSDHREKKTAKIKAAIIEEVAEDFIAAMQKENLTKASGSSLEEHAYSVNNHITDAGIRNLNIFAGV